MKPLEGAFSLLAFGLGVAPFVFAYQSCNRSDSRPPAAQSTRFTDSASVDWPASPAIAPWNGNLSTKWVAGKLYVRLSLNSETPRPLSILPGSNLTVEFIDRDGFTLFTREIPGNQLKRAASFDPNTGVEKVDAYLWDGTAAAQPELYSRVARIGFSWNGIVLAPLPSRSPTPARKVKLKNGSPSPGRDVLEDWLPDPAWKNVQNWRRLAKGMSPDQVREILGEPTHVNSGFVSEWIYGGKHSYRDAHVRFDSQMQVSGWKEP